MNIVRCARALRLFVSIASLAASAGVTLAQQPTPTPSNKVLLNLIVTDRAHHSIDDVSKDEIQILEEKSPQSVTIFEKDTRPVNYVIAIDRSGSIKKLLSPVIGATKLLISGNKDHDETMLITFVSSDNISTLQEFTSDKSLLIDQLKNVRVEMGQSAVIDAIYVAFETAAKQKSADTPIRRALVVISDGEDRASYYNLEALQKLLRTRDVQIFAIGLTTQLDESPGFIKASPKQTAEALLKKVAEESGGRVFFPKNIGELTEAIQEIVHDLHTQYLLGYQSPKSADSKKFRKIEVKIQSPRREKLIAIIRPGYFVNPPDLKETQRKKKAN